MAGKFNPFKVLYQKFGLKKLIITIIALFVILLPSVLAVFLLIDSNKSNDEMSSDSLTVIMYSPEGKELYREYGRSENYSESSLVGIFNVMRKNLSPIDKIPVGADVSTPIGVEIISKSGTESFTYYFSFAEGSSYCEWNQKSYNVLTADSERFLASPFAEILYTNAIPPSLLTADGESITPSNTSWYYKNTDRMYINSTKIPLTDENNTYHIVGGISMEFVDEPHACSVEIFDGDEKIFSGALSDAEQLTLDSNTSLSVKIFAEWLFTDGCSYYGSVTYDFNVMIHSRAEFSISADSISRNGFTVLKATNISNLSKLKFTSDQLSFSPIFTLIGDTAYAVIPCTVSGNESNMKFTVTYGISSRSFDVSIDNTNMPSAQDIISSAQHFGVNVADISSDFNSPIFLFGSRISPTEKGFIIDRSYAQAYDEYYSFQNKYIYSGNSGVSVSSICGGKVSQTGTSDAIGNYAVVDIGLGLSLVYSQLSCIDVSEGEFVAAGGCIGKTSQISTDTDGFSLMLIFDGMLLDPNVLFQ